MVDPQGEFSFSQLVQVHIATCHNMRFIEEESDNMKESFDPSLIERLESPERKKELPASSLLKKLQVNGEVDVLDNQRL